MIKTDYTTIALELAMLAGFAAEAVRRGSGEADLASYRFTGDLEDLIDKLRHGFTPEQRAKAALLHAEKLIDVIPWRATPHELVAYFAAAEALRNALSNRREDPE